MIELNFQKGRISSYINSEDKKHYLLLSLSCDLEDGTFISLNLDGIPCNSLDYREIKVESFQINELREAKLYKNSFEDLREEFIGSVSVIRSIDLFYKVYLDIKMKNYDTSFICILCY